MEKYGIELEENKLYAVIFLLFSKDGLEGESLAEVIGRFDSDLLIDMIEDLEGLNLYDYVTSAGYNHEDIKPYEALVELEYVADNSEDDSYEMSISNAGYKVKKLLKLMIPQDLELELD